MSAESVETECFYARQAAEMAVKAVYVAAEIPHPNTRDIGELLRALKAQGVSMLDEVNATVELTAYSRYPDATSATENDRVETIRLARAALDWAKTEIARNGSTSSYYHYRSTGDTRG